MWTGNIGGEKGDDMQRRSLTETELGCFDYIICIAIDIQVPGTSNIPLNSD